MTLKLSEISNNNTTCSAARLSDLPTPAPFKASWVKVEHAKLIINSEPSVHAFASPSAFENILQCPFFAKCKKDMPQQTSEAAEKGRRMHNAVYDDEALDTLPEEERKVVLGVRKRSIEDYDLDGYNIEFEHLAKIHYRDCLNLMTFGTIDVIIWKEGSNTLLIRDHKFGKMPVKEGKYNEQLKPYAVAMFEEFPWVENIYVQIDQPYCEGNDEMFCYTREKDYDTLYDWTSQVVKSAEDANWVQAAPCDACRWCWKDNCKAYQIDMKKACEEFALTIVSNEELAEVPSEELVAFCDDKLSLINTAKQIIKNQEDIYKKVLVAAGGSDNYAVVTPAMRKKVDWQSVAKALNASEDLIEENTTYVSSGEPYLRKKTKKAQKGLGELFK